MFLRGTRRSHGWRKSLSALLVVLWPLAVWGQATDSDNDGVADASDNCRLAANGPTIPDAGGGSQRDADADGFGNLCDGDLNQDLLVNTLDLGLFKARFLTADPVADLNGDGIVNSLDLGLFKALFTKAPGPAGLPPQISGLTPGSVSVGQLVTISGSNLAPLSGGAPTVTVAKQGGGTLGAPVGAFSAGSVSITVPAGAATGPVSAKVGTETATSGSPLTIVASSSFSLTAAPATVSVIQGKTGSVSLGLSSGNNFPGLATLSVSGLPSGVTGSLSRTQIAADQSSLLTLTAPAGQTPGTATFSVSAAATVDGIALNKATDVELSVTPVTTSFLGRAVVDDPQQTPLAGVTVTMLGVNGQGQSTGCTGSTVSDEAGNFALTNLPAACAGGQLIRYDGSTATNPPGDYAGVDLFYEIVANQVTESPVLIHLPRIDNAETVMVRQNVNYDQTFRFEKIPNLAVTIYAGTTFTLKDGSAPDPFPLTAIEVPVDRLPDTMPPNPNIDPFIVAFQPANATASQPVAVTFPNTLNTPPSTQLTLMTLDPTQGVMVTYGTGLVSANGTSIVPDLDPARPGHRYGLVHFDWHGPSGPAPNQQDPPTCNGANPTTAGPVDLATGIETLTETDLAIPAPGGGVSLARTYRTQTTNAGPFGIGAYHNYSYSLNVSNPSPASLLINLILPQGNQLSFFNSGGGSFINTTTPALRGVVMTVNGDNTTDVRFKSGTIMHFVPGTFLLGSVLNSITDSNGNQTKLVRDVSRPNRITQIIDSVGRRVDLTYDANDRITQVKDPIGRTLTYTYNTTGRLAAMTDPEGGVTSYGYVAAPGQTTATLLGSVTDARGIKVMENFYGLAYGPACAGAKGVAPGDLDTAAYAACLAAPTTIRDQRVWKQVWGDGGATGIRYTLSNPAVALSPVVEAVITDPRGNSTSYRYSTQGVLLNARDPTGQVMEFDREPGGNLLLGRRGSCVCHVCGDIAGGDSQIGYDDRGNVTAVTDALGRTTSIALDPTFSTPTRVTDPLGNSTTVTLDGRGNSVAVAYSNGRTTSAAYTSRGLPAQVVDALGSAGQLAYDAFGNLVQATDPLGNVTRLRYDGVGRLVEAIDALGSSTRLAYDKLDRVVSMTDGNGGITTFTYDAAGNLLSTADARGSSVVWTYDASSRPLTRRDAAGRTQSFGYDVAGNLTRITDRRGQVSQFDYDALNRLVRESYQDGAVVTRSYDPRGRLVEAADSVGGTQTFGYDATGALISQTGPNGTINYTRDALGRVASYQVTGESAVTYSYDVVGNLTNISKGSNSVTLTYNAGNLLTAVNRSNGANTTYSYDAAGRLLSMLTKKGSEVLNEQFYTYDAASNRKSHTVSTTTPLITAAATADYDVANRMLRRGGATYSYDENGNRISKVTSAGTTTYAWDTRNRLTSISLPDGSQVSFRYDAFGNLISVVENSVSGQRTSDFLVDEITNVVRAVRSGAPVVSLVAARGLDSFVFEEAGGVPSFRVVDGVNSTVAVLDANGLVREDVSYEPFGERSSGSSSQLTQFTGRLPVPDELYYYRARFYDPVAGRFLSEDPIGGNSGDQNLYRYVGNDPISLSDPSGNCPICIVFAWQAARILAPIVIRQVAAAAARTAAAAVVRSAAAAAQRASLQAAAWATVRLGPLAPVLINEVYSPSTIYAPPGSGIPTPDTVDVLEACKDKVLKFYNNDYQHFLQSFPQSTASPQSTSKPRPAYGSYDAYSCLNQPAWCK